MKPKVNTDLFELQPNQTATISRSLVIIIADKDPVTCGDVISPTAMFFWPSSANDFCYSVICHFQSRF